ncbi:unnamed protein product [Malus baccata var. baccata]
MHCQSAFNLLLCTSLTLSSLFPHGWGAKCSTNEGAPICPMCAIINVHLKFNTALPLAPLQTFSFNYSHQKYLVYPKIWYFQRVSE